MTNKERKRLYRSRDDKVIAGVCGGLGDFFTIDPVWIRVIFLVLLVASGISLLVYLIMWLIVPNSPVIILKKTAEEQ